MKATVKNLTLTAALCATWLLLMASFALALLPQHSDLGCLGCHNLHGGSLTGLLVAADSESTCLSCHGIGNPAGYPEAVVHNPLGVGSTDQGYITCRECHNPHDNIGSNIKLIGYAWDPETNIKDKVYAGDPPVLLEDNYDAPAIRVELTTTDIGDPAQYPIYRTVTYTQNTDFNIDGSFPGPGVCQICHAPNHNVGVNCTSCHPHDKGFQPKNCTDVGCHDGAGVGALSISDASPHATNAITSATGGVVYNCADCHSGHGSGTIEIPNNTAVGINYGGNGEDGISLGSVSVPGDTEAEICWNCHDAYGVSEWGTNTGGTYDYGSVYTDSSKGTTTSAWLGSYWVSAAFSYKEGWLNNKPTASSPVGGALNGGSTHGTNGGAAGVDVAAAIGCSYCHDVHDTMGPVGKPFLRGSWRANPFSEDGAPRLGEASYALTDFGGVPRGGTGSSHPLSWSGDNKPGGWQIEQNNAAFSWTDYATDAGLCNLCHSGEALRIAWGPHAAVVPGLGNTTSYTPQNIFRTSTRGGAGNYLDAHMRHANTTAGNGTWMYGLRNAETKSFPAGASAGISPIIDPDRPTTSNLDLSTLLGITVDDTTTDSGFHSFPCAKCHNPHASRLPRLMITNCLDVRNNTWDDDKGVPSSWGNYTAGQLAYSPTAVNCHRYVKDTDGNREAGAENGWNTVTPWAD